MANHSKRLLNKSKRYESWALKEKISKQEYSEIEVDQSDQEI